MIARMDGMTMSASVLTLAEFTWTGFIWGVLGSVVAGAFLAFTRKTWQMWLGSARRNIFARSTADMSGDYDAEYWELGDEELDSSVVTPVEAAADPDGTEKIALKHTGRYIEGRIVRDVHGMEDRVSTFTGECADLHVTGTYRSTNPTNPERGSFCLKISNGGRVLRGGYLWYNTREGKESVDYGRYVWRRK